MIFENITTWISYIKSKRSDRIVFLRPISGVGLLLIALGTGGIKPCVVSFGADQFKVLFLCRPKKRPFLADMSFKGGGTKHLSAMKM